MQSRLIEFLEIINIFFSRSIYFLYFNIHSIEIYGRTDAVKLIEA